MVPKQHLRGTCHAMMDPTFPRKRSAFHYSISRGSVILPCTALAAAVKGLTNRVRAPTPWRPSKLRLLVLIEYCPAATVSPFIPRHMEQPDSRQSAPAALNMSA